MTRLTPRCMDLLRLLRSARWLSTSQLRTRFFAHATPDAVRKRLRKLTADRFLVMVRQDRMSQALFTLGREGKRTLESVDGEAITLERKPPTHWEHFAGMNDLRIAAEMAGDLSYFFAYFELPGLGWNQAVIPDGIFTLNGRTFAIEFDRGGRGGGEGIQFFVRTKIPTYRCGFEGFTISSVLIVTESKVRMESLARAIGAVPGPFLFSTISLIRRDGFLAPVFFREPGGEAVTLV